MLTDVGNPERIEVEWELNAVPEWAWPSLGDRVWVMGRWVFDCGHGGETDPVTYRTEIHPPRAVAVFRERPERMPVEGFEALVPATRADVFISGYGGRLIEFAACTDWLADWPDCRISATVPINDRDYEFDIPVPQWPDRPPDARLQWRIVNQSGPSAMPSFRRVELGPGDIWPVPSAEAPTHLHVRVRMAGLPASPPPLFASSIILSWDKLRTEPLDRFRVTTRFLHVFNDLDGLYRGDPV